ncbi:MAG: hypothetical protein HFH14_03855 [Lachnospiraceae bacterium]|nr:hypothetical protein [Lachnospiraceae bacterium]
MRKRIISAAMSICMLCTMAVSHMAGPDVSAAAKAIKVAKKSLNMKPGETAKLKVTVKPAKLKKKLTYKSSKKKVAKVNQKGKITALKAGKAKITVKVKGLKIKAVCNVKVSAKDTVPNVTPGAPVITVKPTDAPNISTAPTLTPAPTPVPAPSEVTLNENDIVTVEIGQTYNLKSSVVPEAYREYTEFKSDREWVASVDQTGKVTALYPGMTIVSLSSKSNPDIKARLQVKVVDTSIPEESFDKYNSQVPHGQVKTISYKTDYRNEGTAQARVWTPADYSEDNEYNILFCLHGGGGDMWYWTNDKGGANDGCSADKILDNMYAEGLIEPCVVVFPNGTIPYDASKTYPNIPEDAVITDWGRDSFLLEYEILYNLMPYMNENYHIAQGSSHTAVCGLSMGGGQTIDIGLKNPDVFGYVGSFSACPFADLEQTLVTSFEDTAKLNGKLKLFTLMVGSEDGLANGKDRSKSKDFINTCTKYELNNMFVEESGLAHEDACWDRNLYKFLKYAFK